ncbi:hypothetical protein [Aquabacterium sp. NJ1]|uniref:DUF7007 domain-containing protein n=1 Tax=Aquabacterium sp. NJ1 TaxID=1538295 RepID=UPI0013767483|nr:hypothetical protein [Aquabacterium sp. NJ1]
MPITPRLSQSLITESSAPGANRPLTTLELRTTCTPWGAPDYGYVYLPGITLYGTPSHGGFYLSPVRLAALPPVLASFPTFCGEAGWFEEDCDWCYAVLGYPRVFEPKRVVAAFKGATTHCLKDEKYQTVARWLTDSTDPDAAFLRDWVSSLSSAGTASAAA